MKISNSQIGRLEVFGKIPFLIQIEDSLLFPKGVPYAFNDKHIQISIADIKVAGVICLKKESSKNTLLHMAEDLNGELSFTKFLLLIDIKDSEDLASLITDETGEIDHKKFAKLTARFINKFLKAYKIISNKYWVSENSFIKFSPYTFIIRNREYNKILYNCDSDFRGTGNFSVINEEQRLKISDLCCRTFGIYQTSYYMQESNRFKQNGEYGVFTLYLAFFIESWIYRESEKWLKKYKNMTENEAKIRVEKYRYPYRCIQGIWNKNILQEIKETLEFKEYKKEVSDRRNDIAHGREIIIDEEISNIMVKKAMNYRDKLLEYFEKQR